MKTPDSSTLIELVKRISSVKVLVVGDVMLDRYWSGSVGRISPEAPVPVLRYRSDMVSAGGAANVAANIVSLGAGASLLGIVGDDAEANVLRTEVERCGIADAKFLTIQDAYTTVKTRLIGNHQQMMRMDREGTVDGGEIVLGVDEVSELTRLAEHLVPEADVVIVSDYAKGVTHENFLHNLIPAVKTLGKKILVDPKGKDFSKYTGASMITPNRSEAADAAHLKGMAQADVEVAGASMLQEFGLEAVLITQSEDGMTLFQQGEDAMHIEASKREFYDVTGAGDTVIATLAAALAAGADYSTASYLANISAGIAIGTYGTDHVDAKRLLNEIAETGNTAGAR